MSESESGADDVYDFTLVRFLHRSRRRAIEEIDVVVSDWLEYDGRRGKCTSKFMESVTNEEDVTLIHNLVKILAPAPDSWPKFSVEIVGRAKSYNEALQKLKVLKTKSNVLTEDTDNDVADVQKKMENAIKQKQLQSQLQKMKSKFATAKPGVESPAIPNSSVKTKIVEKPQDSLMSDKFFDMEYEDNYSISTSSASTQRVQKPNDDLDDGQSVAVSSAENVDNDNSSSNADNNKKQQQKMDVEDGSLNRILSDGISEPLDDLIDIEVLPVIELESFCKTDFEMSMMRTVTNMSRDILTIKTKVESIDIKQEQIIDYLMDKKVVKLNETIDFSTKYKYTFPLTSTELFIQFDKELATNKLLKSDVVVQLKELCDHDYIITKSLNKMLKFLMTKEVAIKFTAMRSARNQAKERQLRFITTNLYNIMCAVIKYHRNKKTLETTDKVFLKSISEVICNVKQWN